jgi:hypothetical protein
VIRSPPLTGDLITGTVAGVGGRAVRVGVAVGLVLAAVVGTGCADEPCPDRPTEVVRVRDVEIAHEGPALDPGSVGPGSFVLEVSNSVEQVERVRLAIDGRPALDIDLPPSADCSGGHPPAFTVVYDLPPGPIEVALDLQGSISTRTVEVPRTGTVWGLVDVQSERAWGDLQVYDTEPVTG